MATANIFQRDILELGGWRTEEQLLELLLASGDVETQSMWCGESLLLSNRPNAADAEAGNADSDAVDENIPTNCSWYPCNNAPSLLNFYSCAKSQIYTKSDRSLLLSTRPLLISVNDVDTLDQLVRLIAKDAPVLSARPLVLASLELVQAFTCVYRRQADRVVIDNQSVAMLRADFNDNGDLVSVRYEILWLMGYGVLSPVELEAEDFTAFCFFYSLMEHANQTARAEYYLDDAELALSVAYPPAFATLTSNDLLRRINVARCLAESFGVSDESLDFIYRCASAALNLRLVRVVPDPRKPKKCVQFERHENLERAARLLGLETELLMREVTIRYEVLRDGHRKALRNRTAVECNAALAGMTRAIYRRLVQFVVAQINLRLSAARLCDSVQVSASTSSGRMTLLIQPSDLLRGMSVENAPATPITPAREALNFELNYLCDLLGCLRARLITATPLLLLGEDAIKVAPEALDSRGYTAASNLATPSAGLIDAYRSLGSAKSPTLLGVIFGRADPASAVKKVSVAGSSATEVFRLSKVKGAGSEQMILEVRHWLGTQSYRLSSLASLAPYEAEAAGVFLAKSTQLLRQRQIQASGTLTTHSLTLLTSLLTDPEQLNLTSSTACVNVKPLFIDRLPSLSLPSSQALMQLRACHLAAIKACDLFQCSTSRHRLLATFSEAVLPYTLAEKLGACRADAEHECSQDCLKAGQYVSKVAKRGYAGPLLVGRKHVFCHYRHLLGLYRTQSRLQASAVLLQSQARRLAAKRQFIRLKIKAAKYSRRLADAFRAPLQDGSQQVFYEAVVASLTTDVWRANWSLIESHLPGASNDGASLLPDRFWAELLAFGSGGRLLSRTRLSGQRVLLRCVDEGSGPGADEGLEFDQAIDIDAFDLQAHPNLRGNLALLSRSSFASQSADSSSGSGSGSNVLLTRLSDNCPVWCWGYWDPESVACGRRAVELGSNYPLNEAVAIFDRSEWVAHLCRQMLQRECRVRLTRLRCIVPVIVGASSVALLASAPLCLLVVHHAELRNLIAVGGNSLDAEVAESLANYRRFGDLEPRRRWAKVHSNQAPMQLSSLLARLQMLDPTHEAEDEAARLRLLGDAAYGGVSACDSAGRRIQWAKQQAKEKLVD